MEFYWTTHEFYTGNRAEDTAVNQEVLLMIQAAKSVLPQEANMCCM